MVLKGLRVPTETCFGGLKKRRPKQAESWNEEQWVKSMWCWKFQIFLKVCGVTLKQVPNDPNYSLKPVSHCLGMTGLVYRALSVTRLAGGLVSAGWVKNL